MPHTEIIWTDTESSGYRDTFAVVHVEVLPLGITAVLLHFGISRAVVCIVCITSHSITSSLFSVVRNSSDKNKRPLYVYIIKIKLIAFLRKIYLEMSAY
jgi:hypothetical protein